MVSGHRRETGDAVRSASAATWEKMARKRAVNPKPRSSSQTLDAWEKIIPMANAKTMLCVMPRWKLCPFPLTRRPARTSRSGRFARTAMKSKARHWARHWWFLNTTAQIAALIAV